MGCAKTSGLDGSTRIVAVKPSGTIGQRMLSRRVLPLVTVLFALLTLLLPWGGAAHAHTTTIMQVVAVNDQGDALRFPADARSVKVTLPDDWSETRSRQNTPVWYRATFDRHGHMERERMAALIDRACGNALVLLNGEVLHDPGTQPDVTRLCRTPLLLPMSNALLRETGNQLDIKVSGRAIQEVGTDDRSGWLSPIDIGPLETLQARAEREQLLRINLPRVTTFVLWVLGAMMLILGRVDRRDSHLKYFGGLLLVVGLLNVRQWWGSLPLPHFEAEVALVALLPFAALSAVQFFLRYAGWRSKPIEVALYAQCAIVPASLIYAGQWRVHTLAGSWSVLLTIEIIVAMAIYLWTMWHRNRQQFFFMLTLCVLSMVFVFMLLMLQQDRTASVPDAVAQHGLALILVILGLRLTQQFGRELQVSEASRRNTELRVREATLEIEKNFSQLAELRVEQVTAQERKRIAGDLHDDLGAKLLTIVHTSDNERISSLAREALEEMRLSVRGLTGKPVKLVDALGDWRAEFVQRVSQTGLEADWESPADESMPQTLSARAYVQTTRILREAVNNIIKHAAASRCGVTVTLAGSEFQLAIQDNGKGIPTEVDGRLDRGHGMASMKHRAKQLHGQCLVESAPGYGTVIRLTLPLDRHVEPT
jgi:two-component system, NarL family, sensor histidine kinase UhpB